MKTNGTKAQIAAQALKVADLAQAWLESYGGPQQVYDTLFDRLEVEAAEYRWLKDTRAPVGARLRKDEV